MFDWIITLSVFATIGICAWALLKVASEADSKIENFKFKQ